MEKAFKYILYGPGLAILYLNYIFPKEWGSKKNSVGSARRWNQRKVLAPVISVSLYVIVVALGILGRK